MDLVDHAVADRPIAPAGETGTVDTGLAGRTRVFDTSVSSPPGGPLSSTSTDRRSGRADNPASRSVDHDPVHVHRDRQALQVVSGDLFVDDYQFNTAQSNELGDIPYRYRVGR